MLWCYLRNSDFKKDGVDYHVAADLTGQANHLGVTIEADIIKQKMPENNGGYNAFSGYGRTNKLVYDSLTTDNPIDLTRWQVANCYMGRAGLINSGGESKAPATSPLQCGRLSSTSAPAVPVSSPGARRSSGRWRRAWSCCRRSRTCTSTPP